MIKLAWKKKPQIETMDMALFLQELLLILRTGATIEAALQRTLPPFLRIESLGAYDSLTRFAQRMNDKAIWRLHRLIAQYRLNGSISTLEAMGKFHDELWQERLANIRKKAEKVTIQLTLLLMLSLISIIAVIMTPVVMMLKQSL